MFQRWCEVCFLHWPVDPDELQKLLPKGLTVDTWDDKAWIGIVPFRMEGIRFRYMPAIPGTSAFPEMNVRTYVRHDDKPGVWFISLDAASALAVATARAWFGLPYFHAKMSTRNENGTIHYASMRKPGPASLEGWYRGVGAVEPAKPGSFDHFLVERYCLYAAKRGRILRGDIKHEPWPLQRAETELAFRDLSPLPLPDIEPVRHYAAAVDVDIFSPYVVG